MKLPQVRINPTSRIAASLHVVYLLLLPLIVLFMQAPRPWGFDITFGAVLVVILSKWRMFAVRPRYWMANIRANSIDIIVGLSVVVFMSQTNTISTSLIWAGVYAFWLIIIKPRSSPFMVSIQALIGQGMGLVAVFNNFSESSPAILVLLAWVICYSAARHLLIAFEDESNRSISHIWALFAAELALILGHWHIVYLEAIPQVALVLSVIGYSFAIGYYLHKTKGLSASLRKQLIVTAIILVSVIIVFSEWQSETF